MTSRLECLIVDDDPVAQKLIQAMVEKTPFLHLKKVVSNPLDAITYLKTETIDLIFLDIEMPGINGLQFVDLLDQKPHIIIVSGKANYALDAFRYNVVDYLLKPVTEYSHFLKAALKVMDLSNQGSNKSAPNDDEKQLFVKVDSILQSIPLQSLLYIEANGDYVKIITETKVLLVLSTMKTLEEKLPDNLFARVHRSFIVNITRIENIDIGNLQVANKIIPVSSNYRDALVKKINIL